MAHAALNPPLRDGRRLAEIGMGAAWIIGICAAVAVVDAALSKTPLAAALAAALVSDFAAGFAGVRWDSIELIPKAKKGESAKDESNKKPIPFYAIGFGAASSTLILGLTLGIGALFGWVSAETGTPSLALLLALLRAGALAVRDELCFRGIALVTASRAGIPTWIALLFGALAGGASMAFASSFDPAAMALAIASGGFFGALWLRFKGAWAALSAHTLFLFLIGPGMRGGLLDIVWSWGALAPKHRSYGGAAWLCASLFAAAALLLLRAPSASSSNPGQKPSRKSIQSK